ncbi:MAG: hypothetical protein Q4D19_07845 [Lautropia sp.]|nr:hypothetical protein [Lautropia sp.]
MTTLTIEIQDNLAEEADQAGLLDRVQLSEIVSNYLIGQIEQRKPGLPRGDRPITEWLARNPLPAELRSTSEQIDAVIEENRRAWD